MDYRRWGAAGGIAFVTLLIVVNSLIGASAKPGAAASVQDIAAWYEANAGISTIVSMLAPLMWVSLAIFAVGILVQTRSQRDGVNPWAVMAIAGVVMQNAIFSGVIATDAILAVRAAELVAQPQFTQLLWDLNHAAFGLNPASLTVALGGFALAVLSSGTAPRWLAGLGLAGAAMLVLGAVQVVPVLEESPTTLIAFGGFFVWIGFIVAASVVMLRPVVRPEHEHAPTVPAPA